MNDPCEQNYYYKGLEVFDPETQMRVKHEIERRVNEALYHEEQEVQERRERLRKLYDCEAERNSESSLLFHDNDEEKYEEMKRKIIEVETRRERERMELVKTKRTQQQFLNCEEIRSVLSKQQQKAIKKDQWWQIKEKLAISNEKTKADQYYHDLILQNVKDAMALDEETSKLKWQNQVKVKEGYVQQIELKNKRKEREIREKEKEKLEIQVLIQKNKEIEENELRDKKKRSEELANEMKMLIEREHFVREQRRREEQSMEDQIELIGSRHKEPDKLSLKRELDAYRACLEELTKNRKLEERKFDERLEELTNQREALRNNERMKMEIARKELVQSVLLGRDEQLQEKTAFEKAHKELSALERQQLLKEVNEYRSEVEQKKMADMEKKREYAEHLRQQMREREENKIREKEAKAREKEAAMMEEARLRRELEDLTINPPNWERHPLHGVQVATYFIPPKRE